MTARASYLDSKNVGDVTIGVAIHAVVGGTAAELGGGKFANGAQTGAFSYLFNECLHTNMCSRGRDSYSRVLTYPDGTPVSNPNGGYYQVPDSFDMSRNLAFGESGPGKLAIFDQMRWGGDMDYQRPGGLLESLFKGNVARSYVDLGNYNFGVVLAAAGYDLSSTVDWARAARQVFDSKIPLGPREISTITQGWKDYAAGRWPR